MTQQLEKRGGSVCDNIPVYGWLFSGALKFYDFCISFDQPDPWVARWHNFKRKLRSRGRSLKR